MLLFLLVYHDYLGGDLLLLVHCLLGILIKMSRNS